MYKRILVPVDGSDTSSRGLAEAIRFAKEQQAQLKIVHVFSDAYLNTVLLGGIYTGDLLQRIRNDATETLQLSAKRAAEAGVMAETQLLEHPTSQIGEAIVQDARRWKADLIVMGTHGRRGVDRVMMGSDAEYIVRHAPAPVLLLRG
jgi:nucleotide-binding universal stress UspA family protein